MFSHEIVPCSFLFSPQLKNSSRLRAKGLQTPSFTVTWHQFSYLYKKKTIEYFSECIIFSFFYFSLAEELPWTSSLKIGTLKETHTPWCVFVAP